VAEELARLGWRKAELLSRMKSDPRKLAIAARLRRETTLPPKGIAARVRIGAARGANALLHFWMQGQVLRPTKAPQC
jgi:hypothetical protein